MSHPLEAQQLLQRGLVRVVIEAVAPQVDCGRFAIKRVLGETVRVEADLFTDGHDAVAGELLYRREGEDAWRRAPMRPLLNDRWGASFEVDALGRWHYCVRGWVDHFET